MKFKRIYPQWAKLDRQTEFHLPPHGPAVFADFHRNKLQACSDFINDRPQVLDLADQAAWYLNE
jgi:hypothetical protein